MISIADFRKFALSLPGTEELAHFDMPSFRVKKKIFATYHEKEHKAMLKLSPVSQSVFCAFDTNIFYPVPGGWGQKGATFVNLSAVPEDMFNDELETAYKELMSKK